MTQQQFIEEVAKYVQKYAPQFNIKVCSPIIAQACLESAYGTSAKAQHHNYFGLKYRKNRVTCNNGYFSDSGSEQKANGSYIPITDDWYSFENLEMGVLGYFQFTNIANYANLKGVTDPYTYLVNIKNDKYATSANYVQNNMNVINKWDLTKYDTIDTQTTTTNKTENNSLVTYTRISPHKTSPRNHKIDTITIHCIVGQWTAKQGCDYFATTDRSASANYVVGKDGSIGLSVDEADRAWTSSNKDNDNRAVTIEVASDTTAPYAVTDAALSALIKLCADICKRNGIKELKWKGDPSLIGQIDKQNMTVHRWFAKKACPGEYLYSKHGYIADEVNKLLNAGVQIKDPQPETIIPTSTPSAKKYYRVQIGAYKNINNANAMIDRLKKLGVNAIIKEVNGLYKVQVGAYGNKANAEDMVYIMKIKGFDAIISYN